MEKVNILAKVVESCCLENKKAKIYQDVEDSKIKRGGDCLNLSGCPGPGTQTNAQVVQKVKTFKC